MAQEQEDKTERRLLVDKIAIVTGGASGIGKAIAKEFLREGAKVAIFDIQEDSSFVKELPAGSNVSYFKVDITDRVTIQNALKATEDAYGPVNILVNNAGIDSNSPLESQTDDHWNRIISVNLNGTRLMTRIVGGRMKELNIKGNIIFITSIHTAQAFGGESAYDASKHGVVGLMRVAAEEWAKFGIRSNAIAPGAIYPTGITKDLSKDDLEILAERIPVGRVGKPEDIAYIAAFIASDKADFINGAEIRVDGGSSIRTSLLR